MRSLLLAYGLLILSSPLFPQEENGASLTIRFGDGTSRFHVGEIIPVELSFKAAAVPDLYDMSTRNYDRSGRLNIEQFHLAPPGRDPLQSYYAIGGFMTGGLGSSRVLSSEPEIMREDLNEWVALDKPGHYLLYVTSGRVSRRTPDKAEPVEPRAILGWFGLGDGGGKFVAEGLRNSPPASAGEVTSVTLRSGAGRAIG